MKDHLPWESYYIWECPVCGTLNCWNDNDAQKVQKRTGRKVVICYGSYFDNVCGHCHSNIVEPDSPILASCYTHSED